MYFAQFSLISAKRYSNKQAEYSVVFLPRNANAMCRNLNRALTSNELVSVTICLKGKARPLIEIHFINTGEMQTNQL